MRKLARWLAGLAVVALALALLWTLFLTLPEPEMRSRREKTQRPHSHGGRTAPITSLVAHGHAPQDRKRLAPHEAPRLASRPALSPETAPVASAEAPLPDAETSEVSSESVAVVTTRTCTFAIHGHVVDEAGLPVPRARVSLWLHAIPRPDEQARAVDETQARLVVAKASPEVRAFAWQDAVSGKGSTELATAESDREGRFDIRPLTVDVPVSENGEPSLLVHAIARGDGMTSIGSTQVDDFLAGAPDVVDVAKATDWTVTVSRLARLRVLVRAGGSFVEGASVLIRDDSGLQLEKKTDERGVAEDDVPGSAAWVSASKTGFATEHRSLPIERDDPVPGAPLLPLAPLECVVDLVPDAAISGTVVDADGKPVEGAEVSAKDTAASADGAMEFFTDRKKTDAEGRFDLHALTPGRGYDVVVAHDDDALLDATKEATAPARGVVIVLVRAGRAVVGIRVPPDVGKNPPQITVTIQRKNEQTGAWESARRQDWSPNETGEPGSISFTKLRPGTYRAVTNGREKLAGCESLPFEVVAGDEPARASLDAAWGRTAQARIVDSSGAPISGATISWVSIDPESNDHQVVTDATGRFSLQGLPLGEALLDVVAEGFLPRRVAVPAGATAPVDIVLERQP